VVDTQPGHERRQVGSGGLDLGFFQRGTVPAQKGLLHDVLRLTDASQHPVRNREQERTELFKFGHHLGSFHHASCHQYPRRGSPVVCDIPETARILDVERTRMRISLSCLDPTSEQRRVWRTIGAGTVAMTHRVSWLLLGRLLVFGGQTGTTADGNGS
jgi:hypothetical protein